MRMGEEHCLGDEFLVLKEGVDGGEVIARVEDYGMVGLRVPYDVAVCFKVADNKSGKFEHSAD